MRNRNASLIPNELANATVGGFVTSAELVKDYVLDKSLEEINSEYLEDINFLKEEIEKISPEDRHVLTEDELDSIMEAFEYNIRYVYKGELQKLEYGLAQSGDIVHIPSEIVIDSVEYRIIHPQDVLIVSDNQVINVELEGAYKVQIRAMINGEVVETFESQSYGVLGEPCNEIIYYPKAIKYENQYYTVPSRYTSGINYGINTVTSDLKYGDSLPIQYTLESDIVYYFEVENALIHYGLQAGAHSENASEGKWYFLLGHGYLYGGPLDGGIYSIEVVGKNQNSSSATILINDMPFTWNMNEFGPEIVPEISIAQGEYISIKNDSDYDSTITLDYVIVRRI